MRKNITINNYACHKLQAVRPPQHTFTIYLPGRSHFPSESEDVKYANNYARIIAFVAVSPVCFGIAVAGRTRFLAVGDAARFLRA